MWTARKRFSPAVLAMLEDTENLLFLSVARIWEMAIKAERGRLPIDGPIRDYLQSRLQGGSVTILPISVEHALRTATLPRHHGDPFDRMLVAQAQAQGLVLLTDDREIGLYDVALRRP